VVSRTKQGKAYLFSFNYTIWPELKDFVTSLQEYQVLRLVPREGLLIKSYGTSVLFKSLRPQDATPHIFQRLRGLRNRAGPAIRIIHLSAYAGESLNRLLDGPLNCIDHRLCGNYSLMWSRMCFCMTVRMVDCSTLMRRWPPL